MNTTRWAALAATLALPLLSACYSDLRKRNDDLANANHQLENEINQVKAERDEVRAREKTLKDQVNAAEDSARLAREQASGLAKPAGASHDAGVRESNASAGRAASSALAKKLGAELDSVKATVDVREGRVVVSLPASEEFSPGSAELSARGKTNFQGIGKRLASSLPRDARVWIVGHTDADPPKKSAKKFGDNRHLSVERAMSVAEVFAAAGIAQKRMVVAGYGEHAPVAAGSGDKEKARNRRVELWID